MAHLINVFNALKGVQFYFVLHVKYPWCKIWTSCKSSTCVSGSPDSNEFNLLEPFLMCTIMLIKTNTGREGGGVDPG